MPKTAWEVAADIIDPQGPDYAVDPVAWNHDKGVDLWSKQEEILLSIVNFRNTAVHSCHNAGKSFTASDAAAWWIDSHPLGTARVVTTAPTDDQVKGILWYELGRLHRSLDLAGQCNLKEWMIGGEMVAMGRKPSEYSPTAFQGIHAQFVLVILDEACGIPASLWEAGSTMASNETSRMLAIGNPDDPNSEFAKKCKPGSGWNVIHIGAEHTPNFSGEKVAPVIAQSTLSRGWAESKALEWGADSPLYISKVLGLFPEDSEDGVVPASWAAQCRILELDPTDAPVRLGVDVGAGGDQSVIRERRGNRVGRVWRSRHGDPDRLMGEIIQAIQTTGAEEVLIDSNGIGWGIAGWLRDKKGVDHEARIVPVNVSQASSEPKRFLNLRAELWWMIGRELSRTHSWDLGEVEDDVIAELIAPKYKLNSSGKIVVEPKDEVKKRLGRSPDDADAMLLSFLESHSLVRSFGKDVAQARLPGVKKR